MPLKSQPLIAQYVAWNTATNQPATGDAANHAVSLVGDGYIFTPEAKPSEVDAVAMPGVYRIDLSASDMSYNFVTVGGKSSTPYVVLVPVTLPTDRGSLPAATANTPGGLGVLNAQGALPAQLVPGQTLQLSINGATVTLAILAPPTPTPAPTSK